MNSLLKHLMLFLLIMVSAPGWALELGSIQVKSGLGQPLRVEIPVHTSNLQEWKKLKVKLAPGEVFSRTGLAEARPRVPLKFSMVDDRGRKHILVTSSVPVNNPYIELLIELSTAAGTSVHDYPVLLDPPKKNRVFGGKQQHRSGLLKPVTRRKHKSVRRGLPRVPVPGAGSSRSLITAAKHARHGAMRHTANRPLAARSRRVRYGKVKRGQTLWSMARVHLPQGVSMYQMVLALKQANPKAFYSDNINALMAGMVLRIPTREEALAIKMPAAATAKVRRQNRDWHPAASHHVVSSAAHGPVSSSAWAAHGKRAAPRPMAKDKTGDFAALVLPMQKGSQTKAGTSVAWQGFRSDRPPLPTHAAWVAMKKRNAKLRAQLQDLQQVDDKKQKLLALKNQKIAALQASLEAVGRHAVASLPASDNSAVSVVLPGKNVAPAATTRQPEPHAHLIVSRVPASSTPWYMQHWMIMVAAGVVVLGLLLLWRLFSRSGTKQSTEARKSVLTASSDPEQDELLEQLAVCPDDVGLHLELASLYYGRGDSERFEATASAMVAHVTDSLQDEWVEVVRMGRELLPRHPLFLAPAGHGTGQQRVGLRETVNPDNDVEHRGSDPFDFEAHPNESSSSSASTASKPNTAKESEDFSLDWHVEASTPDTGSTVEPVDDDSLVGSDEADTPANDRVEHVASNPVDTKIGLARFYLDMGDFEASRAMLDEVMKGGDPAQKQRARELLDQLP